MNCGGITEAPINQRLILAGGCRHSQSPVGQVLAWLGIEPTFILLFQMHLRSQVESTLLQPENINITQRVITPACYAGFFRRLGIALLWQMRSYDSKLAWS
jgi:hypothetical protein